MFEQLYRSPLHNPVLFWVVGLPLLVFGLWRWRAHPPPERTLGAWALLFQTTILVDATLQGELSPIAGAPYFSGVSIGLVVLGDARWYALMLRYGPPLRGSPRPRRWPLAALLLALVVPAASYAAASAIGAGEARVLFLVYEVMFAIIALGARGWLHGADAEGHGPWLRGVATFEAVQYLLWASADVLILTVGDVGFLLRLFPNAMYYAAFVPFVWWTAPPEWRR